MENSILSTPVDATYAVMSKLNWYYIRIYIHLHTKTRAGKHKVILSIIFSVVACNIFCNIFINLKSPPLVLHIHI